MSEYMEKHSVSRLIGAPPGYVGYDEGGQLTEQVRRKPYSVILFDEVEKAHPDVFNALLQVLDEGRLTDGQGRTVDFKNTVLVMTSNLGSQMIQSMAGSDYQVIKLAVMGEVKSQFRPEFINRIDEIVVFHALDEKNIASIARVQLKQLEKRVESMDMRIHVSDTAIAELAKAGFDPVYGARPLKRVIQRELQNKLATQILEGSIPDGSTVHVGASPLGLMIQPVSGQPSERQAAE
jgi:ATP-dependent Clp protease ATP-binding subunit ClpB